MNDKQLQALVTKPLSCTDYELILSKTPDMPLQQCYRARTINVLDFELFTLILRHNGGIQSSIRRGIFHCSLF
ncbi:hypothetical protein H9L39_07450 [Fusarium oxysporum f. sp. albedinis]|nr:hypothetical protein H9L39_07450 [Fusarium oxysporum f. sp. albedinis]